MAGQCDFIYEYQVKNSPVDEETAAKILKWAGINPPDAEKYYGLSQSRAILFSWLHRHTGDLYPREYQTTGFDRQ
jgi:hypothetical protein